MGFSNHRNLLPMFLTFSIFYFDFGTCLDTITASQIIEDPATVSSNDSRFKLGFFSPENSTNCYVGIWYLSEANVVWIANRDQPLTNSSGIFTISEDGNFVVLNDKKKVIWSSNVSNIATNSTAQLLDSGNLVLIDHTGKTVWESFQHPCNAYIPKMILSNNKITGKKVKLTSWKSPSDPSIGNFSVSLERLTIPEVIIWNHSQAYWRTGPWNRTVFLGIPNMYSPYLYGFSIGRDGDGTVHLTYASSKESVFFILALNSQGKFVRTTWNNNKVTGKLTIADTDSDVYGFCGAFGSCNSLSSPICCCLRGFEPRKTKEWSRQNWTSGCVRRESLQCERTANDSKGDGFVKLQMMKVPDFAEWSSASQDKCRTQCLGNCSCIAYAYDTGIGCMSWSGNLIDIQQFSGGGVDLYIRVAHSELDKERNLTVIITVIVIVGTIIIAACACFLWRWTVKHSARKKESKQSLVINTRETSSESQSGNQIEDLEQIKLEELPLFDFRNIATATNNFSTENKLGKGGFGSVYKGELGNGQEIAVKRLSRASRQGLEEFMNEVVVMSKLQHRNLVRILGCCIEEEEKILIYEYMPNKSLDAFIFDPVKRKVVDWKKRFNIIDRISQGLLYLHRDSRLKIIHRDLKPSNILLDGELNPKISDFGMARIFGDSQDARSTKRIVGTYGYMSPEYAIEGLFSERSDVFSFGILLLEIISGSKNTSFYHDEESLSLVGFAWKLRNENNIISLIDPEISDPRFHKEILRCVDIGLLCVQEHARDRPTMATVISMLNSDNVNLPTPKQPTFILSETELMVELSQTSDRNCSINNVTVTDIQDR